MSQALTLAVLERYGDTAACIAIRQYVENPHPWLGWTGVSSLLTMMTVVCGDYGPISRLFRQGDLLQLRGTDSDCYESD